MTENMLKSIIAPKFSAAFGGTRLASSKQLKSTIAPKISTAFGGTRFAPSKQLKSTIAPKFSAAFGGPRFAHGKQLKSIIAPKFSAAFGGHCSYASKSSTRCGDLRPENSSNQLLLQNFWLSPAKSEICSKTHIEPSGCQKSCSFC